MLQKVIDQLYVLFKDAPRTTIYNGFTQTVTLAKGVTVKRSHDFGDDTPGYREAAEDVFIVERPYDERMQGDGLYSFKTVIQGSGSVMSNPLSITVDQPANFDLWLAGY